MKEDGSALVAVVMSRVVMVVGQLATVEGHATEPTLPDGSAVVVNKLAYRWALPQRGEAVMLYYPVNPDKLSLKCVIAEEAALVQHDRIDRARRPLRERDLGVGDLPEELGLGGGEDLHLVLPNQRCTALARHRLDDRAEEHVTGAVVAVARARCELHRLVLEAVG